MSHGNNLSSKDCRYGAVRRSHGALVGVLNLRITALQLSCLQTPLLEIAPHFQILLLVTLPCIYFAEIESSHSLFRSSNYTPMFNYHLGFLVAEYGIPSGVIFSRQTLVENGEKSG